MATLQVLLIPNTTTILGDVLEQKFVNEVKCNVGNRENNAKDRSFR